VTEPEIIPDWFCAANGSTAHKQQTSNSQMNLRIFDPPPSIKGLPLGCALLGRNMKYVVKQKNDYVHFDGNKSFNRKILASLPVANRLLW
jgi:hypothetical protein